MSEEKPVEPMKPGKETTEYKVAKAMGAVAVVVFTMETVLPMIQEHYNPSWIQMVVKTVALLAAAFVAFGYNRGRSTEKAAYSIATAETAKAGVSGTSPLASTEAPTQPGILPPGILPPSK